jgi:hypothetical protein
MSPSGSHDQIFVAVKTGAVLFVMERKLHNDELHSLYSSPNIVRVIKWR